MILEYLWQVISRWYHVTFDTVNLPPIKCPACGQLQTKKNWQMRYEFQYSRILIICWNCKAVFALEPIVPAEKWKVEHIEDIMAQQEAVMAEQYMESQKKKIDEGKTFVRK